jgi:hypothetical protein
MLFVSPSVGASQVPKYLAVQGPCWPAQYHDVCTKRTYLSQAGRRLTC